MYANTQHSPFGMSTHRSPVNALPWRQIDQIGTPRFKSRLKPAAAQNRGSGVN
jgi:hypothetical protein